jgi:co-chaperonin GroES (HSP10)
MNKKEKKFIPTNDWVFIHLDSPEVVTKSGLIVVNNNPTEEPPLFATVLRAGKKCLYVKPGDRIKFEKYSVVESGLFEDGKKIDMLREKHIELILDIDE